MQGKPHTTVDSLQKDEHGAWWLATEAGNTQDRLCMCMIYALERHSNVALEAPLLNVCRSAGSKQEEAAAVKLVSVEFGKLVLKGTRASFGGEHQVVRTNIFHTSQSAMSYLVLSATYRIYGASVYISVHLHELYGGRVCSLDI